MTPEIQQRCLSGLEPWIFQGSSGSHRLESLSPDNLVFNEARVGYDARDRVVLKLCEEGITKIRQFVTYRVEQVRMLNGLLQLDIFLAAAFQCFPLVNCYLCNCRQSNRRRFALGEPLKERRFLKFAALKLGGILNQEVVRFV